MNSSNITWTAPLQDESSIHNSEYGIFHQRHSSNGGIFASASIIPNLPVAQYTESHDTEIPANFKNNHTNQPIDHRSHGSNSLHHENYHILDSRYGAPTPIASSISSNYPPPQGTYSDYIIGDPKYTNSLHSLSASEENTLDCNYPSVGLEISSSHCDTPPNLIETDHILPNNNCKTKRQLPYAQLLFKALSEAKDYSMPLREIYSWFENKTDKTHDKETRGWQNSIRHNLSMNAAFVKSHRSPHREGKHCSVWKLSNSALTEGVKSTTRYRSKVPSSRSKKKQVTQSQASADMKSRAYRRSLRIRQSEDRKGVAGLEAPLSLDIGSSSASQQDFTAFYKSALISHNSFGNVAGDIKSKTFIPRSQMDVGYFPYEIHGQTDTCSTHCDPSEATLSSRGEALTPADTLIDSPLPEPVTPDTMMLPLEPDQLTWDTFGDLQHSGWTCIGKQY